jgi:hypothetical protein
MCCYAWWQGTGTNQWNRMCITEASLGESGLLKHCLLCYYYIISGPWHHHKTAYNILCIGL